MWLQVGTKRVEWGAIFYAFREWVYFSDSLIRERMLGSWPFEKRDGNVIPVPSVMAAAMDIIEGIDTYASHKTQTCVKKKTLYDL